MNSFNRRDFLKSTSIIAGSTIIASSPLSSVFAAGTDVIRVAVIGCGGRGTGAAVDALE